MSGQEEKILRELGKQLLEAAADPINEERKRLWKALNQLRPVRPMIMIDQIPWSELRSQDSWLQLQCQDPLFKSIENDLRQRLYQFRHFPGDQVLEPVIPLRRCYRIDEGLHVKEEIRAIDPYHEVVSHHYEDQLPNDEALEQIPTPKVWVDPEQDRQNWEKLGNIFADILPIQFVGVNYPHGYYAGFWDRITMLRGMERILYDLVDRPDFLLRIIQRFVQHAFHVLQQCEELGLIDPAPPLVHCTGAYTDELPSKNYDGKHATAKDTWVFGLAQVFGSVSPEMHEEFEIIPVKPFLEHFGLCYYGCCDPLHHKIHIVRKIKNVRKISISPWANIEEAAANIHGDFVLSAKPNPSLVAMETFDEDLIRQELTRIVSTTQKYHTPCELILKDISTVAYQPQRLTRWEQIAREVVYSLK